MQPGKLITLDAKHGDDDRFLATMKLLCGTGTSLIDLCCNEARLIRRLPFAEKVYVDILARDLNKDGPGEQHKFVQADVLKDHEVFNRHYDVAVCSDGIEHLHKDQGWALLEKMKKISTRQVLFTPLDPFIIEPHNEHPESHKCLWLPEDLPDWAHIVVPQYHPTLRIGAFFFWNCPDLDADWKRVASVVRACWN